MPHRQRPRVERLAADLTRAEKTSLALGDLASVDGVVPFAYVDGPNGVRGADGATAFPAALVLAASFDRRLASDYGHVLADEVRAAGANVLLGPAMDVMRVPWAGRSSESFGEDPLVAGELGGTVAAALQSRGVLSIAKHFVANNFERGRTGSGSFLRRTAAVDIEIEPEALHEIYLAPFRRAVQRYGLLGLMASYNRLGGEYVAQNADALGNARDWGFAGVFAPDFLFAVRDHEAALRAGLDLPGLDAPSGRTPEMIARLDGDALDRIAQHIVTAASGAGIDHPSPDAAGLGTPDALDLAERIAVAGTVLLANDGTLPFTRDSRVAVIETGRIDDLLIMGGSAAVVPPAGRAPELAASLARLGVAAETVSGGWDDGISRSAARVEFRDTVSGAATTRDLEECRIDAAPDDFGPDWEASLHTTLAVAEPGSYLLSFEFAGELSAHLPGRTIEGFREASPMVVGPRYPLTAVIDAESDVELRLEYSTGPAISIPGTPIAPHLQVGWRRLDVEVARAAAAAGAADAAVVVVGRVTGEAMDAESIRLPEEQELLLEAVLGAQPRTVVAVLGSGPVAMPWRGRAAAILHLGNSGERGMAALARVLTGDAEPGGRLPFTVPAAETDVPVARPTADRVHYDEGLEVGYRAYDRRGIEPAFPFGHGLGFAALTWSDARILADARGIRASALVTNTSKHDGVAVPQLYVTSPGGHRALRGFDSVRVPAGASVAIDIEVPLDDLAGYSADGWRIAPGEHRVELATSSRTSIHEARVDVLGHAE